MRILLLIICLGNAIASEYRIEYNHEIEDKAKIRTTIEDISRANSWNLQKVSIREKQFEENGKIKIVVYYLVTYKEDVDLKKLGTDIDNLTKLKSVITIVDSKVKEGG